MFAIFLFQLLDEVDNQRQALLGGTAVAAHRFDGTPTGIGTVGYMRHFERVIDLNARIFEQFARGTAYHVGEQAVYAAKHHQCRRTLADDLVGDERSVEKFAFGFQQAEQILDATFMENAYRVAVAYHARAVFDEQAVDNVLPLHRGKSIRSRLSCFISHLHRCFATWHQ